MQIAEGIDVQNIRETGREKKVLEETGEHVPRVALQEVLACVPR